MKKIRVINIIGPLVIGGAENMVYELAKAYQNKDVVSKVICISPKVNSSLEEKFARANIDIVYAGCEGRVTFNKLYKVYKIVKEFQPSVIHAHMSGVVYGLPWILFNRCKMVVTAHTTPQKAFTRFVTRLLITLSMFNKVILVGVSKENAELMKAYYGLNDKHIKCVNNGIDLSRYYNKDHDLITFVHIGRLDNNKNQQFIIRCFKKVSQVHHNVRLIICGDGPLRSDLESLVCELDLKDKVKMVGNVDNVQDYLAVSDIYLQASHREGLPLSVVEGMAAGLPVISTNVGGMKNVVDKNGFLIADNDADGYYTAMLQLYEDSNLRASMGNASRMMTKPFSSESMALGYISIYRELL